MVLFCINEKKEVIDTDIVTRVIKLMDWQLEVRKAFDPLDCDNKSALMEAKIRRCLEPVGTIRTDRDIKRSYHVDQAGLWIYKCAIKNLLDEQEIIEVSRLGGKHKRYRLNPDELLD
jgi:hypothetical protein